jgi:hypothetical protein
LAAPAIAQKLNKIGPLPKKSRKNGPSFGCRGLGSSVDAGSRIQLSVPRFAVDPNTRLVTAEILPQQLLIRRLSGAFAGYTATPFHCSRLRDRTLA